MEKTTIPHGFEVKDRNKCSMTGIQKVVTSSESHISLVSSCGAMEIEGKNLKINNFNAEDGTIGFEGEITSVRYTAKKVPLLKRLFK